MGLQGRPIRGTALAVDRIRTAFLSRKRHRPLEERRWGAVMAGQPWARLVLYSVLQCLVRSAAGFVLLPKCCPLGMSLLIGSSGAACSPDDGNSTIWSVDLYSYSSTQSPVNAQFNFSHKPLPCTGPGERTLHNDEFWIYSDGTIERKGNVYDPTTPYCLEFFIDFNETYPLFCAVEDSDEPAERYFLMGIGFFLSVPFAMATVIVYLWIRELHSLHGRIVVFNMSNFIVASIFMGLIATRIIKSYAHFNIICGIAGIRLNYLPDVLLRFLDIRTLASSTESVSVMIRPSI
ncbi:unnamed protein product [Nezara viridula]|uniref:Uncharacterized protein n=1 Tax=Nezara viridula TaxID=85310 RepID=A0A9P0HQV0_NEZVI|nr:unnamed protein product [Nezara viridula]